MSPPQTVLITGSNQGLGYLAALQLAQIPGYRIILCSRNADNGNNAVKRIEAAGEAF
jgi:NAD(P)-dependent dehydrogenase (short-subunit alcohol dehydrogenase family)